MAARRLLTYDDIAHYPVPGANVPVAVRFSPDGGTITYLYSSDNSLTRELWAHDRATGREWRLFEPPPMDEADLSLEEKLRRERQRQLATGVTGYAWSEQGDTLLIQAAGETLVRRGLTGDWRTVGDGPGVLDPRLCRDGGKVAYVRDGELYCLDLATAGAAPVRLTHDASPAGQYGDRLITNGLAEFVAQEEMGRSSGFWWSRDGAWLAFEQVDTSAIPLFYIPHPGTDDIQVEAHRYPFAGKTNAAVRLGVVAAGGGPITWLTLTDADDCYLARVHWTPDGLLLAQIESRDQTRLELRRIDPRTGEARTLWTDTVTPWVNLHDDLRFVRRESEPPEQYQILWSSERSGRRELYLYGRDGALLHQLSRGDLQIDLVRDVDAERGAVFVEGWQATPLERQLFRIPLAGGAAEQVTTGPGIHATLLAPDHQQFIDSASAADRPPAVSITGPNGTTTRLHAAATPDPRIDELALPPPRLVEFQTGDGETLYGAIYPPRVLAPGQRAPVVVDVYGGPHAQQVTNSWGMTVDLRAQHLAQQGFLVLTVDNRGSARRGLAFEAAIHRRLGEMEVQDQVAAVRALATLAPEADLERVGVYGWSYGGYLALMCLARAGDTFKAAVAGAPVTHWDGYDTHYTERYMGHPDANPDGYRRSSVMARLGELRGRLLVVHGMIDENVHFRHTGRLIDALNKAGTSYDLLALPEERHSPRSEQDRAYLEQRIAEFFIRAL